MLTDAQERAISETKWIWVMTEVAGKRGCLPFPEWVFRSVDCFGPSASTGHNHELIHLLPSKVNHKMYYRGVLERHCNCSLWGDASAVLRIICEMLCSSLPVSGS